MGAPGHDVTELLRAWGDGDVAARDRLLPLVRRDKRSGRWARVTLDEAVLATPPTDVDVLDLDAAPTSLAAFDERKSRIAEMRFFGGLSLEETGEALGLSVATVERDWQAARAWLFKTRSRRGDDA